MLACETYNMRSVLVIVGVMNMERKDETIRSRCRAHYPSLNRGCCSFIGELVT